MTLASCGFAQNVYEAWQTQNPDADGDYTAYSPTTGQTYTFSCGDSPSSRQNWCAGGSLAPGTDISWSY